jgi:hypothetical protein
LAHIVRRHTIGRAQDLYNDLIANIENGHHYEDSKEFARDNELLALLANWISVETARETQVDE